MTTLTRVQTQRKQDMIFESKIRRHPVYESALVVSHYIVEAELTQDQIKQIFQTVSDTLSGDKSNRTALGKVADGAKKVGVVWGKVKSAISKSGPMSGFDVAIDKLQGSILDKLGGKGGAVGKALDAYKKFAKQHPIMQGAIYTIFVTLGVFATAGGPAGIAAVAAAIKTVDRLLQGDKASSALWKGFKAGSVGAAAAGLAGAAGALSGSRDAALGTFGAAAAAGAKASGAENKLGEQIKRVRENRYIDLTKTNKFRQLAESRGYEVSTVYFTQAGVTRIFENVITEGMWDRLKGAVKSGISSATNKVTFDKLDMNWRRGGNPAEGSVDSEKIKEFLRSQGVKDDVIDAAMSKIVTPAAPKAPSSIPGGGPSAGQKSGIEGYVQNWAKTINAEKDPTKKIELAKEVINFLADRKDQPEAARGIAQATAILKRSGLKPSMNSKYLRALSSGDHVMERAMYDFVTAVLKENGMTWRLLGYRPLLNESAKGYVVLQQI